jgi:hypothetical protein
MLNMSVRPQPAAVAGMSALAATAGETSSDEILVKQIAAGSKSAMHALFARHRTYSIVGFFGSSAMRRLPRIS